MKSNCPHCGKPLDLDHSEMYDIDLESAAVELVLSQMARIYRHSTNLAYATIGDRDLDAIRLNLFVWNEEESPADSLTVSGILKKWKQYVDMSGERAEIEEFFYSWLPATQESAQVIPFRQRFSQG